MEKQPQARMSLVRLNARLLAVVFIIFEVILVAAVLGFVMIPMVRRSADDLAGLMILSAQTWSELPPETRPAFEEELIRTHWLSLRAELPAHAKNDWHGFYLYFLEQALSAKTGNPQHFIHEMVNDDRWFWASLPSGGEHIAVGFPAQRVGTHPIQALLATILAGLFLAIFTAIWLARRITRPLNQLELAVAEVGRGQLPELVPEKWPLELASLADRINQMARQVRELLAARTTLLAGVSHDLRTPLSRMRLALALLADEPDPVHIERLERDIETMDLLIGKILDLARGLEREPLQEVSLPELLRDVVQTSSSERVLQSFDSSLGLAILPPVALRRVVGNLLENALRYAPAGSIELIAERSNDELRIGVLDRGPGIPLDQLELVFQPFQRVESSRSTTTGGSGLGLAIVKQIAGIYGWRVKLCPRAGGGLEGWVIVPVGASPGISREKSSVAKRHSQSQGDILG